VINHEICQLDVWLYFHGVICRVNCPFNSVSYGFSPWCLAGWVPVSFVTKCRSCILSRVCTSLIWASRPLWFGLHVPMSYVGRSLRGDPRSYSFSLVVCSVSVMIILKYSRIVMMSHMCVGSVGRERAPLSLPLLAFLSCVFIPPPSKLVVRPLLRYFPFGKILSLGFVERGGGNMD
jgi:hypothetical protein